ncbi:MAG: alpha/beta hydrolase [Acidobacteria bacterium]|nr:alpha/beta hydrolase [Acidobacteriota bacterium]
MSKKVYFVGLLAVLLIFLTPAKNLAQNTNSSTSGSTSHTLTGKIENHPQFFSKHLSNKRDIIIYLPPNYDKNPNLRYPVLYLHDGQNIFDGATSFIAGQEWQCDETAQRLILANKIQPLIIVGVYNTGEQRVDEYTPSIDARYNKGGKAALYGKFLVEELKPFIDKNYRTFADQKNTALGGSSLGGLVSLFIGLEYPEVFGKLAIISPSVWWDNRIILKEVDKLSRKTNTKIWLDIGSDEGEESLPDTRLLRNALINKGWRLNQDLKYLVAKGAKHNEQAWASRFSEVLGFLFSTK